jgi:hypothetical protein
MQFALHPHQRYSYGGIFCPVTEASIVLSGGHEIWVFKYDLQQSFPKGIWDEKIVKYRLFDVGQVAQSV